ncbi:helix-turn-helix domain-containing protein [Paraburkholderia tropica]|uniref:winged helix-turn-helix transcriptional regulator n=1 Tax=Paraburkholderia tropica TaxID=92647 RepID=UPI0030198C8C
MKKPLKNARREPIALLCNSDEAKVVREFMAKIGDKWSIMLVVLLGRRPTHRARFSELQKLVTGISQRMLSTTLRGLERDGFLIREVFPEVPPRVEYELTARGLSLLEPLHNLVEWIGDNWESIKKSRETFDKRPR